MLHAKGASCGSEIPIIDPLVETHWLRGPAHRGGCWMLLRHGRRRVARDKPIQYPDLYAGNNDDQPG